MNITLSARGWYTVLDALILAEEELNKTRREFERRSTQSLRDIIDNRTDCSPYGPGRPTSVTLSDKQARTAADACRLAAQVVARRCERCCGETAGCISCERGRGWVRDYNFLGDFFEHGGRV